MSPEALLSFSVTDNAHRGDQGTRAAGRTPVRRSQSFVFAQKRAGGSEAFIPGEGVRERLPARCQCRPRAATSLELHRRSGERATQRQAPQPTQGGELVAETLQCRERGRALAARWPFH